MGRPKEHGEDTRRALLAAAEGMITREGPDALSVRAVARACGTTTRSVYSLFGSKEGLLVALAVQAIAVLDAGLRSLPESSDPGADLVEVGATMYRRFVLEHPSLYRLAFQRIVPGLRLEAEFAEAREATFAGLIARVQRLADAGCLRSPTAREGAAVFNAMCEGLANAELRGGTLAGGDSEAVWRRALSAVVTGLASP